MTPDEDGEERRRAERVVTRLSLAACGEDGEIVEMETLNLSSTGVSCLVWREVPLMARVKVTLALPLKPESAPDLVRGEGIVVRVEKVPASDPACFKIALFFSSLEDDGRALIEKLVSTHRDRGRDI